MLCVLCLLQPEIFKTDKSAGYGPNVDMFSVGCVVYTLLCGMEPFYGEDMAELVEANKSGKIDFDMDEWEDVSEDAIDWLRKAMAENPANRMGPREALAHDWIVKGRRTPAGRAGTSESGGEEAPMCILL